MTVEQEKAVEYNRRERGHLDVLQRRLDWLRQDRPERRDEPGYVPGETQALMWGLDILSGRIEPMEVRIERCERELRRMNSRVGRIEHELEDDEEEVS